MPSTRRRTFDDSLECVRDRARTVTVITLYVALFRHSSQLNDRRDKPGDPSTFEAGNFGLDSISIREVLAKE